MNGLANSDADASLEERVRRTLRAVSNATEVAQVPSDRHRDARRRTPRGVIAAGAAAAVLLTLGLIWASRADTPSSKVTASRPDMTVVPGGELATPQQVVEACTASGRWPITLGEEFARAQQGVLHVRSEVALAVAARTSDTEVFIEHCLAARVGGLWSDIDAQQAVRAADPPSTVDPLSLTTVSHTASGGWAMAYGLVTSDVVAVHVQLNGNDVPAVLQGQLFASVWPDSREVSAGVDLVLQNAAGATATRHVVFSGRRSPGAASEPPADDSTLKAPPAIPPDGSLPPEIVRIRETCEEGEAKAFRSRNNDGVVRNEDVIDGVPNDLGTRLTEYGGKFADAGRAWSGGRCAEMNRHLRSIYGPDLIP